MNRVVPWILTVGALCSLGVTPGRAEVAFSFSPSGPLQLQLGETVAVELQIAGITSPLDLAATTLAYDGTVLTATAGTAGPIVPNAVDDFSSFTYSLGDVGYVDAYFQRGALNSETIDADGTFFTFQITGQALGQTDLTFDYWEAWEFNGDDPDDPLLLAALAGSALSVLVVPEPSCLVLATWGAAAMWGRRRRRFSR